MLPLSYKLPTPDIFMSKLSSPQSVANWVDIYVENLPPEQKPESVHIAELDELYTLVGNKKTGSTS